MEFFPKDLMLFIWQSAPHIFVNHASQVILAYSANDDKSLFEGKALLEDSPLILK